MSGRKLPVLNFAPFRRYPTRLSEQEFDDERRVCGSCLSGVCCSSEDPIYLTSFDIFRLAAFFDLTPAEFLLKFTQERFDGEDSDVTRRPWIDDPNCSKVTYLRRRGSTPKSPCVFLKYVRDEDGTPRRICSVHDARPLSCREYYFSHCKTRQTGELAALLAEGYEKVRDGEITKEMADAQLARLRGHDPSSASAPESMEYAFWFEMRRVLDMERANVEGGRSYDIKEYQDPIDEKLNRVLSAKYLRFEEYYGGKPNSEQLMPYTSGLSFTDSPERARIMKVVRTRPSVGLYAPVDYPFLFGMRTMVPGVRHAEVFPTIPDAELRAFLDGVPPDSLFPDHEVAEVRDVTRRDVYAAVLKGLNHIIRFCGYLAAMGNVLEIEPQGLIELDLLGMIAGLGTSRDKFVARNPYVEPVRLYTAGVAVVLLEELAEAVNRPPEIFDAYRRLRPVEEAEAALPPDLRQRISTVAEVVGRKLRKYRLEDYVRLHNPVAERLAAGKSLKARGAWAAWERSADDVRYAAGLGGFDVPAYYRRAVGEVERVPFEASYAVSLCRVVVSLARGMRQGKRVARANVAYGDALARLASRGTELLGWVDGKWGVRSLGDELLAGFASHVYGGTDLGRSRGHYPGLIVRRLLDSQLPDGSWGTDPPADDAATMTQEDYLGLLYQPTWACLDALLQMLTDGGAAS